MPKTIETKNRIIPRTIYITIEQDTYIREKGINISFMFREYLNMKINEQTNMKTN